MKKKEKIKIEDMTMKQLDKEITTCKRQAKALKLAFIASVSLLAASMLSFITLLSVAAAKNKQESKALAKLVEEPKKEWILEESNKLIDEMKNDSNITPESLADYNNKINAITSISNYDYISKHGSEEIKTEYATIEAEYNPEGFFTAGMSCAGAGLAMAFPVSFSYVYWHDKKNTIKECQRQQKKSNKYNEKLNHIIDKVVTSKDIEQEYK